MVTRFRLLAIITAIFLFIPAGCGHLADGTQTDSPQTNSTQTNSTQTNSKPAGPAASSQGQVLRDVPDHIERSANYFFYLHGRIIEEQGIRPTSERWGVYEYEEILSKLKARGLVVISEPRPRGTDIEQYASKVIRQIERLLKAGVAPQRITVAGASKGSVIAMYVSMRLKKRDVNYVLMGNCNDGILTERKIDLWGNVLSIFDASDDIGGTCQKFFEKAQGLNKRREVELKTGLGHGFLYRAMSEWIDPAVAWAIEH